jgi:hypothetical protein
MTESEINVIIVNFLILLKKMKIKTDFEIDVIMKEKK